MTDTKKRDVVCCISIFMYMWGNFLFLILICVTNDREVQIKKKRRWIGPVRALLRGSFLLVRRDFSLSPSKSEPSKENNQIIITFDEWTINNPLVFHNTALLIDGAGRICKTIVLTAVCCLMHCSNFAAWLEFQRYEIDKHCGLARIQTRTKHIIFRFDNCTKVWHAIEHTARKQ